MIDYVCMYVCTYVRMFVCILDKAFTSSLPEGFGALEPALARPNFVTMF